ncbi:MULTISPECIES: helicase-exonuclease AddAB subunit AddB [Staphylococcus]|uniref:helicase-exonuclease AddAB subunit AddB n=1 Tax=Staphylococcus TaxID=1279 RepID=UPI001C83BF25|nr:MULTISPECIES: helicase-exonuclease AddAB subunit AddB [Staphylococcus]MBX5319220.1 helicase-exonuclease AddAB subunit AddB [Staphylococcus caprae]MCR6087430.1 helicase-exonuclease AddAB subunit AddB [Staphylococcus aureus]
MELNTYIGRAGTGKSASMLDYIKNEMKQDPLGDPIILIAPTQSTFQLEQAFVNDPELNGSLRTEVLHFERLSHRVFQEVGGFTEQRLSKAAMEMMIYHIVQQHESELKLYRSQSRYYGFSEKLAEQIQDFKKYSVTPEHLEQFISEHQLQTRTQHKLEDISLIYRHLEARMSGEFITTEDSLEQFIDQMSQSEWLKRAEIFIDGFHNFSTLEYRMIEALVQHAKKVTVLLTTDGNQDQFSLFRKPSEVLTHLEDIASHLNIELNKTQFNHRYRFENEDLKHLESDFDALQMTPQGHSNAVEILESSSMREEVNELARRILRDVRDDQLRFQDIAILYRDESYAYLFDSIFPLYDIPFNIDTKKSMSHHPIMEMIRSLIEVIQANWNINAMLRLFKTDILTSQLKNSSYLIDLLENFVLERGVYGNRWLDEDIFNVEQFNKMGRKSHALTPEERETYEEVIRLKNHVIDKVLYFEKAMSEATTVRDFATAFYESMEYFELPNQLMTERDELDVAGAHQQAEEIDQIWNGFIQILDDLVTVFDTQDMTLKQFLEVFDIGLEQLEFVMIPQTLDQVSIGTMDLAKVDNKQHVYMVGMNDGSLPQPVSSSSLITDEEKKYFEQNADIELSPTSDILQMDEAFVCYIAMTRARQKVTFSYSLMGNSGDEKEISPFLSQIKDMYHHLEITNIHQEHEEQPISLMQHVHQTKIELFDALRAWLDQEDVDIRWLDAYQVIRDDERLNRGLDYLITSLTYDNETIQLNESLTQQLYGKTINASVSRFEGYQQCPFKHYASHGLRLNERTKYELQNFDLGDIFHSVLKHISDRVEGDFKNLDRKKIRALTEEALEMILPKVQFNLLNSSAYYKYLSRRICSIVETTLSALKYQTGFSKFVPQRFETGFRKSPKNKEELVAQPLHTKQGIPINIRGQIDRIDTYTKGDHSYVNIIDYKSSTSSATLDLTKVYYGLQMQMMTYMDIVLQNQERLGLTDIVKPGGLLYFHVHEPRIKFENWSKIDEEKLDKELIKSFKMSGLLNSDEEVIDAIDSRMEPSFTSDIVPLGLTTKGAISKNTSRVADEDVIRQFIKHNKNNFIDTATHIMDGHTEVAPLKYKNTLSCQFCSYQSVCHVDGMIDSKRYRTVDETIKPLELIQKMIDEGGDK